MREIELTKNDAATAVSAPQRRNPPLREWLFKLRALIALALLIVIFSTLSPAFLTTGNLLILAKHVAINAILAIGMTYVILTGGIDLSVGSVVGLDAASSPSAAMNARRCFPAFA
jgi:erythritol transport system permease protein